MSRILIVQTAFIGDVILATAFVRQVANAHPDSEIHFLCRKGNEDILFDNPKIKKVLIWNKKKKYRDLIRLIFEIRSLDYDKVYLIQRYFSMGLVAVLSGARAKVGFSSNPLSFLFDRAIRHKIPFIYKDRSLHEVERNSLLCFDEPQEVRPELFFNDNIQKKVEAYQNVKYIVCTPCSVWKTKEWPREYWKSLISNLSDYKVLCLGGPEDNDVIEGLIIDLPHAENLAGKLSLRESAALMRNAVRVFVNDSGPLHLASAVNAATTVFFCSTIPEFGYGPLSEDSVILQSPEQLECRPCGTHGKISCPLDHFNCGRLVTVEMAIKSIGKKE